jgi:hypothetical protein
LPQVSLNPYSFHPLGFDANLFTVFLTQEGKRVVPHDREIFGAVPNAYSAFVSAKDNV